MTTYFQRLRKRAEQALKAQEQEQEPEQESEPDMEFWVGSAEDDEENQG